MVMFYWAVSAIGKQQPSKVQDTVVKYLQSESELGLQPVGVIVHARKYLERRGLNKPYRELIHKALETRLSTMPGKQVQLSELTHLKLIAQALGKERSQPNEDFVWLMDIVCRLLESVSDVPKKEKKGQFEYLKNPQKRQSVLGNYCQILLQVCFKHPSYTP